MIDDRPNRAAFSFPAHECGSFGEREWRSLEDRRRGLRTIGTRWSGFGTCNRLDLLLGNRRSEFPRNRGNGVRLVGAEDPGLDASREDFPHRGIALRDSFQHRLDRLGDALPGSLRSGPGPAITSTQSYGAREFT